MVRNIIKQKKSEKISELLDNSNNVVIVTHLSPDGDALGSSLGLYHYLMDIGLEAQVIVPNSFPSFLDWMPATDKILNYEQQKEQADSIIKTADLIFCLDFNTLSRIGQMADAVVKAKADKIMIDHHPYPDDFCNVTVSHPEISSASELLFRVLCSIGEGLSLSRDTASCIYVGMMTDTGAFTYNSNNPEIYNIISHLISLGINKDEIYDKVFNNYTINRFKMQGYVFSNKLMINEKLKTAVITLSKEEQERFKSQKGDTEGFANMPLCMKNIFLSVFFRQDFDNPNLIKLSLRSKGNFPCNEFSSKFYGGGGHLNAAGGEFYGTMDEAVEILEKNLPIYQSYFNS